MAKKLKHKILKRSRDREKVRKEGKRERGGRKGRGDEEWNHLCCDGWWNFDGPGLQSGG